MKEEKPTFEHPQQQSDQPSTVIPINQTDLESQLEQVPVQILQAIQQHRHDGTSATRVNFNTEIIGLIESVTSIPTGTPISPYGQLKIYTNKLYWYDTNDNAWHTASGGSVAGSDTQVQFNDGGSFGASANFIYNKTFTELDVGDSNHMGTIFIDASGGTTDGFEVDTANSGIFRVDSTIFKIFSTAAAASSGRNGIDIQITPGVGDGAGHQGNTSINSGSAISTSANGGFLIIPKCAGTPTGAPTTGSLVYDTTNNKLYFYNGAWKSVTFT